MFSRPLETIFRFFLNFFRDFSDTTCETGQLEARVDRGQRTNDSEKHAANYACFIHFRVLLEHLHIRTPFRRNYMIDPQPGFHIIVA